MLSQGPVFLTARIPLIRPVCALGTFPPGGRFCRGGNLPPALAPAFKRGLSAELTGGVWQPITPPGSSSHPPHKCGGQVMLGVIPTKRSARRDLGQYTKFPCHCEGIYARGNLLVAYIDMHSSDSDCTGRFPRHFVPRNDTGDDSLRSLGMTLGTTPSGRSE